MPRKKVQDESKEAVSDSIAEGAGKLARSGPTRSPTRGSRSKAATPQSVVRTPLPFISVQERRAMIAEAAYYRAEKRGDGPGDPEQDWYEAEAQIEQMLEGAVSG